VAQWFSDQLGFCAASFPDRCSRPLHRPAPKQTPCFEREDSSEDSQECTKPAAAQARRRVRANRSAVPHQQAYSHGHTTGLHQQLQSCRYGAHLSTVSEAATARAVSRRHAVRRRGSAGCYMPACASLSLAPCCSRCETPPVDTAVKGPALIELAA
jgi:hypothetical protein